MKLQYAKSPKWANPQHTLIDIIIKWDSIDEEFPFTASPNDTEQHGRAIFESAILGEFGEIGEYSVPTSVETPIPNYITARQARLALLRIGLLDDVDTSIAAIADPIQRRTVEIEWEYSNTLNRNSLWVQSLASALGITEEQLDALFVTAASL